MELQLRSRVDQLAILLGNTSDASFHALQCIGILPKDHAYEPEDEAQVCYGLVFDLQVAQDGAPSHSPRSVFTLSELYAETRKPSLNERLTIALALAETVLQLHTTGWLHKGLRPDNVLFLQYESQTWDAGTAKGPYLAGYDYARPSNTDTETTPSQPELELYRRPSAQGPARSNFNKQYDLFALGCILIEIALWRSLKDIFVENGQKNDANINEKRSIYQDSSNRASEWTQIITTKEYTLCSGTGNVDVLDIAFHAGETFKEVILLCLYATSDDPDDESLETQKEIVDKLRNCKF